MRTETLDILSEDFETPTDIKELEEVIKASLWVYENEFGTYSPLRKKYRNKVNEMIVTYNEAMRGEYFTEIN